jgi:S1-C subfamily serine protease
VDLLDLLILLVVVLAAVNGYRRGAALQLTAYAGLFGGLVIGAIVAPHVARLGSSPFAQAAIALIVLIVFAAIGDGIGWLIGTKVWALARRGVLGTVDSIAGSLVAVVAVLLATWFVAYNLSNGPFQPVARQIRGSEIVRTLHDVLPQPPAVLAEVKGFLNRFGFPEVFAGLPPAPAGPVDGPTSGQTAEAAHHALGSTVRIEGQACGAIQEGSGFVVAEHYVVTNAHVVAGVHLGLQVQQQNGGSQGGTVVVFDPRLDIAVIRVGTTPGPALKLDGSDVQRGAKGAVLGYPEGGSLKFGPAAVRQEIQAVGRDIYGQSTVSREVYELQAIVRPGNSGGPFELVKGQVAGVVFAASTTDPNIGYAIASPQVIPLVHQAEHRTDAVSTEGCAR